MSLVRENGSCRIPLTYLSIQIQNERTGYTGYSDVIFNSYPIHLHLNEILGIRHHPAVGENLNLKIISTLQVFAD